VTEGDFGSSPLPDPVPHSRPALPGPRRKRNRRLLVVFGLLAAAFVFLLVEGLGSSLNYFDTVDQAYAHRATLGTTTFRLEGDVVPGSIHSTKVGTNFTISDGDRTMRVSNTGSPPQLFQSNIPVVVVGHFASTTSLAFMSNQILVKHSATYIAAHPNRVKAKNGTVR
jgi:cytochrome c-type biogenesis protein CcmE